MIREELRQEATTAAVILVPIGVVLALSTTSDGVAFLRKVTPYSVAIFLAALVLICEIVATIAIYKLAIINGRFLFNSVSDRLLRSGLAICGVLVLIIGCAGVVMDVSSLASGATTICILLCFPRRSRLPSFC